MWFRPMTERPFLANGYEVNFQVVREGAGNLTYLVPCGYVSPMDRDRQFGRIIY
jgi:hypothetical protein